MLDFEILTVGPLGCNCIILWEPQSKLGVVVDPGDEPERISGQIKKLGLTIQAILLTHAHFDHVGGVAQLQSQWNCPVFLHPEDIPLIECLDEQTRQYRFPTIQKPIIAPLGDDLPLNIKHLHTPGHSLGSSTFLADSPKGLIAMTGDTLFAHGVGRSDLWGGSWESLENSIRTHLYTLGPDTFVIPGHGSYTTIAAERSKNPYVRG
jgi:glyoxylase-like metal-dependent hydrolase (beta-lactamase superfamily II)